MHLFHIFECGFYSFMIPDISFLQDFELYTEMILALSLKQIKVTTFIEYNAVFHFKDTGAF